MQITFQALARVGLRFVGLQGSTPFFFPFNDLLHDFDGRIATGHHNFFQGLDVRLKVYDQHTGISRRQGQFFRVIAYVADHQRCWKFIDFELKATIIVRDGTCIAVFDDNVCSR